jgi:hypothetical protein
LQFGVVEWNALGPDLIDLDDSDWNGIRIIAKAIFWVYFGLQWQFEAESAALAYALWKQPDWTGRKIAGCFARWLCLNTPPFELK